MNSLIARVNHLDRTALLWLHLALKVPLLRIVRQISRSGDGVLYVLFALLAWTFDRHQGKLFLATVAGCFVVERLLYWVLKNSIRRDRPAAGIDAFQPFITPSDKFSFPSGHTAAAFMFAALVLHFYPGLAVVSYAWASMIGMSRVLLGVHYPTDIVAGAVLGSTCAMVGLYIIGM